VSGQKNVFALKTDEEIGFMRTAIDHELVDPKVKINFEKMDFCIKNTIKRNTFYTERE
jgi:hypothetical protein